MFSFCFFSVLKCLPALIRKLLSFCMQCIHNSIIISSLGLGYKQRYHLEVKLECYDAGAAGAALVLGLQ